MFWDSTRWRASVKIWTCVQNKCMWTKYILHVSTIWWEHTYRSARGRMTAQSTGALGPAASSVQANHHSQQMELLMILIPGTSDRNLLFLLFTVNQETELPVEHFISSLSILKLFTFCFAKSKHHLHFSIQLVSESYLQNTYCKLLTARYIIALGITVYKHLWNKECISRGFLHEMKTDE